MPSARRPLRDVVGSPEVLDELLERALDEAGGLRLTGEGSMLGDLVKAVLERALEAEMTVYLRYERSERGGAGAAAGAAEPGGDVLAGPGTQAGLAGLTGQPPKDRATSAGLRFSTITACRRPCNVIAHTAVTTSRAFDIPVRLADPPGTDEATPASVLDVMRHPSSVS